MSLLYSKTGVYKERPSEASDADARDEIAGRGIGMDITLVRCISTGTHDTGCLLCAIIHDLTNECPVCGGKAPDGWITECSCGAVLARCVRGDTFSSVVRGAGIPKMITKDDTI